MPIDQTFPKITIKQSPKDQTEYLARVYVEFENGTTCLGRIFKGAYSPYLILPLDVDFLTLKQKAELSTLCIKKFLKG